MATYFIPTTVTATLIIQDGHYAGLGNIIVQHPCSSQITIQGQNTYDRTISSVSYVSGTNPSSVLCNMSNTANIAVGDYVLIQTASGGTRPLALTGCATVTAIVANTSITITLPVASGGTPTGAVTATARVIKSVLGFAGDGFTIYSGFNLSNLVLVPGSSNSGITLAALATGTFPSVLVSNIGVSGGNVGLNITNGGLFRCINYLCVSGCSNAGMYVSFPGTMSTWYIVVNGCGTGVWALTHGIMEMQNSVVHDNTLGVTVGNFSFIRVSGTSTLNNVTDYSPAVNVVGNGDSIIVS